MRKLMLVGMLAMAAFPAWAQNNRDGAAGGAVGGGAAGAVGGAIVGGPVGAAVGGVAGAAAGAIAGSLTPDDRTYVRQYVTRREVEPTIVQERVVVGKPLPGTVRTYRFEGNSRLERHGYARINKQYVVIDADGNVMEVLE